MIFDGLNYLIYILKLYKNKNEEKIEKDKLT